MRLMCSGEKPAALTNHPLCGACAAADAVIRLQNSFICTHAAVFFLMGDAKPCGSGVCSPPERKCGKNGLDVAARKQDWRFFIHSVMS